MAMAKQNFYKELKGLVTSINNDWLSFKLDDILNVHMSIFLAENPSQKLPAINSHVSIKYDHDCNCNSYLHFVACPTSVITGEFSNTTYNTNNVLTKLVKNYKLGASDLLKLINCYDILKRNIEIKPEKLFYISVKILTNNLKSDEELIIDGKYSCLNNNVHEFNIKTPNNSKFVDVQTDAYSAFPVWSFGVHPEINSNRFLVGYLELLHDYGLLFLKDMNKLLLCIICGQGGRNLNCIINKYVLIRNYRIITEVHQKSKVTNYDYILVDLGDIKVLSCGEEKLNIPVFDEMPMSLKRRNFWKFRLTNKSLPIIGLRGNPEYCLEIDIKCKNGQNLTEAAFLVVPVQYLKTDMFLFCGENYILYYNTRLDEIKIPELTSCKIRYKQYHVDESSAFFVKDTNVVETVDSVNKKVLSITETKEYLQKHSELVSFQGLIESKVLSKSLPSRTVKRGAMYGFGTGPTTPRLIFCSDNKSQKLDFYLNNWENILSPVGLIPNMRVLVKNALPQSKKYVKATAFTTIEVLSYEPTINFVTCNLHYDNGLLDWGQSFRLGHGHNIPFGVLVFGRVFEVYVISVKLYICCTKCKQVKKKLEEPCGKCNSQMGTLKSTITMNATDSVVSSRIISDNLKVLRMLLNLQPGQFEIWLDIFKELGYYEFSSYNYEPTPYCDNNDSEIFKFVLDQHFLLINIYGCLALDLKCRKLDSTKNSNGGRPLWKCEDIIRVNF